MHSSIIWDPNFAQGFQWSWYQSRYIKWLTLSELVYLLICDPKLALGQPSNCSCPKIKSYFMSLSAIQALRSKQLLLHLVTHSQKWQVIEKSLAWYFNIKNIHVSIKTRSSLKKIFYTKRKTSTPICQNFILSHVFPCFLLMNRALT